MGKSAGLNMPGGSQGPGDCPQAYRSLPGTTAAGKCGELWKGVGKQPGRGEGTGDHRDPGGQGGD